MTAKPLPTVLLLQGGTDTSPARIYRLFTGGMNARLLDHDGVLWVMQGRADTDYGSETWTDNPSPAQIAEAVNALRAFFPGSEIRFLDPSNPRISMPLATLGFKYGEERAIRGDDSRFMFLPPQGQKETDVG